MHHIFKNKKCPIGDHWFTPTFNLQKCCTPAHQQIWNKMLAEKRNKSRKTSVIVEGVTTLISEIPDLKANAKTAFQKWIRLVRDKGKPCISCDKFKEEMDGGHLHKSELYSGLIFYEDNCHAQCVECNRMLDGNKEGFIAGLIQRYGQSYVNNLERIKNTNRQKKWTADELIDIELHYLNEIKINT